ncbi:MAG: tetratricopeptide repeat protein [Acidobacteriota bacterium]|nr:tetratricopeptide repeat protein [Acidobacteriota bacterium]
MSRSLSTLAALSTLLLVSLQVSAQSLVKAEDLYKHTDYETSLTLLNKASNDGPTNFLIGRDYFMLADFKKSTDYLQKATAEVPKNSEFMDWLGRAYGKRAETSNPLFAPALASKARQAFEKSVELDQRNSDALSDLFDYYLGAPGFLGGGYNKAAAVAEKIAVVDPPEGYFERAKLAQNRREFQTAEQHLRRAIAITPQKVGGLLELAKLLAMEGRAHESDALLSQAQAIQPNDPAVWYARADILIKQKRNTEEAKNLLQKYMRAPVTVDDPPKGEAVRLLRQVGGA